MHPIQLERTADYALLTGLLRDPRLYYWISDDFSPPLEEARIAKHPF